MEILSVASLLPKHISLIQPLYKNDGNPLCSLPSPQYTFLFRFRFEIGEHPLWLLQYMLLINFLFKADAHSLWRLPLHSLLIQN